MTNNLNLSIEQRLQRVEARLNEISDSVRHLSECISTQSAPQKTSGAEDLDDASLSALIPRQGTVFRLLTQIGRGCLILGGAFLVRALTDTGAVPLPVGAAIGLAYACAWILLADRAAGRGQSLSAGFLGVTGVLIADPLILETTVHFKLLSSSGAAIVLTGFTAACLVVSWRRNLPVLAWAAVLAASATAAALSIVTGVIEPFAAAFLVLGIAAAWHTSSPNGRSVLRWLLAAAADGMVLCSALRLPDVAIQGATAPPIVAVSLLALALPLLYLTLFAARTFAERREATDFEILQTVSSLAIGVASALAVARFWERGEISLGVCMLVAGVICGGVAFGLVAPRMGHGRNFFLLAILDLFLTITGSALIFRETALLCLWCGLALVCAFLGGRGSQPVLALHSAAFCAAAAWKSGLVAASFEPFVTTAANTVVPFPAKTLIALITAAGSSFLLLRDSDDLRNTLTKLSRFVLTAITVFGVAGFAVGQLRGLTGRSDAAAVAALGTAVLAMSALLLAAFKRSRTPSELRLLTYAVLVVGAAKLLIDDLRVGGPTTLFVGFGFYGMALLAVPRLLRIAPEDPADRPDTE